MAAPKRWIPPSILVAAFGVLTTLTLTYSPLLADPPDPCDLDCRYFYICEDEDEGCVFDPNLGSCFGTIGDCSFPYENYCHGNCGDPH